MTLRAVSIGLVSLVFSLSLAVRPALGDEPVSDPGIAPATPPPTPTPVAPPPPSLLPDPETPPRRAQPAPGQKRAGLAIEIHLGTNVFGYNTIGGALNEAAPTVGSVTGGLFVGYKIDRVIIGLGFELSRIAEGTTSSDTGGSSSALTGVNFIPGIRVTLARTSDQRVELFGELDFGAGHVFSEGSTDGNGNSNYALLYQVGPGLRYWLHPSFAVSALAGLRGEFSFLTPDGSSVTETTGVTTIFAALQLLGVF